MIKQTSFSASIDESRGIITGVLIEFSKDSINMVALDGFRMAIRTEKINNDIDKKIIIPSRILNEIYKIIIDQEEKNINILLNEKNIIIEIENTVITSRLMEGDFINYKEIIPKNYTCKIKLNKNDLYNSIERASLLAREGKNNLIKIKIEDKKMIITSRSEEGAVHEEVYIEKEGDELEIGFNSKYILDILRNIEDEEIYFEFISNISPCLVRPLDGFKYEYLLLPVRISVN
jgi:DNA polymerase-3 subunit beta